MAPGTIAVVVSLPQLSVAAARRVALAAQGFTDAQPTGAVDVRHLRRVVDRVGLLQIDSVNVLSRSHYLPVFSRLGSYDRAALDGLAYRRRELFEYWAHEASFVPIRLHPQLRWRMARAEHEAWGSMRRLVQDKPGYVEDVLAQVRERGPLSAAAVAVDRPSRPGTMWNWHDGKVAMEWLFFIGAVSAATRTPGFERLYDVTERVIPAAVLAAPTPVPEDAQRELVRVAARGHGVGTERDLRDYFRLGVEDCRDRIAELVEEGELIRVQVPGWRQQAYLHREARVPRWVRARALLSPFDSVIWERSRTERLFDFRYRLEIYTPAPKRIHGYYVLPFLLGDRLAARVDLKADRQAGVLRAQGVYAEPGTDPAEVSVELAAELRLMADWLGLERVQAGERGDLAEALHAVLRSA